MTKAKKKRSHAFTVGLLVYILLWGVACLLVWHWFKGYLGGYEEAVAKHGMDPVREKLSGASYAEGVDELFADGRLVTEYQVNDLDVYRSYLKEKIAGREITILESVESTGEKPRYVVYAGGDPVTDVTLRVAYTNRYGMDIWEADRFYPDPYSISEEHYRIRVPSSTIVTADGVELTEEDIARDADGNPMIEEISDLRNVDQYLDVVPTYTTYEVGGLFGVPEVSVTSYFYGALPVERSEDGMMFTAELPVDPAIVEEVSPKLEAMIRAYGEHFIGKNTSAVYQYLLPNSSYRADLATATTYFYPTEKISSYDFDNISYFDFVTYTDNCCSCEIYFDLIVNFNVASYKTQNEGSDATWVFIKQDGTWYLADVPRQKSAEQVENSGN